MSKKNSFVFATSIIFMLFVCVAAQEKPVAMKVAEYDEERESIQIFKQRVIFFLRRLKEAPTTTFGFIAIRGKTMRRLRHCEAKQR